MPSCYVMGRALALTELGVDFAVVVGLQVVGLVDPGPFEVIGGVGEGLDHDSHSRWIGLFVVKMKRSRQPYIVSAEGKENPSKQRNRGFCQSSSQP
jgi:hypothetical protein